MRNLLHSTMLTLYATSQQACLPALTPGNMKITETITHIRYILLLWRTDPVNISNCSWLCFQLGSSLTSLLQQYMCVSSGIQVWVWNLCFYQIKDTVYFRWAGQAFTAISIVYHTTRRSCLIAPIQGFLPTNKTYFHWGQTECWNVPWVLYSQLLVKWKSIF